jgi:hypothetical protein
MLDRDPYSHGYVGGDVLIVVHHWQRLAVACEVGLLAVGLVAGVTGRRRALVVAVASEAILFAGLNAVWVVRDGATRFLVGYESSFETAYIVVAGLVIRVLILLWTAGYDRPLHRGVRTEPAGTGRG